jgi:hypothetical protein
VSKIISIFFIIGSTALSAQHTACKIWKNGTFITYPAEGKKTIIIRKGGTQYETNGITGVTEELKVKWLDQCTYELTRKRKSIREKNLHPGMIITVRILESYTSHCLVFISSNVPGDVGYYDCLYPGITIESKSITP